MCSKRLGPQGEVGDTVVFERLFVSPTPSGGWDRVGTTGEVGTANSYRGSATSEPIKGRRRAETSLTREPARQTFAWERLLWLATQLVRLHLCLNCEFLERSRHCRRSTSLVSCCWVRCSCRKRTCCPNPALQSLFLEPGAGKSALLASLAARFGTTPVKASIFERIRAPCIVVDAFDEVARIDPTGLHRTLKELRHTGADDRTILSSRSGEWSDADTRPLRQHHGYRANPRKGSPIR